MKKHIFFLITHVSCIFAMENNNIITTSPDNNPITITFDHSWLLQRRLSEHDRRHHTHFYDLSSKHNLHTALGNNERNYIETISFIKNCIKKQDPSLPEEKIIEQKDAIMKALQGKLNQAAKL